MSMTIVGGNTVQNLGVLKYGESNFSADLLCAASFVPPTQEAFHYMHLTLRHIKKIHINTIQFFNMLSGNTPNFNSN